MPESDDLYKKRVELQEMQEAIIETIENSNVSPEEKTVQLLVVIARQLVDQNFKLDSIHNELFEHTLALDSISSSLAD